MIRRKAKPGPEPTKTTAAASDKEAAAARLDGEYAERVALNESGRPGSATVVTYEQNPTLGPLVEERIGVQVTPDSGAPFDATIAQARLALLARQPSVQVGDTRRVVYDPDDQTRVDWRLQNAIGKVHWHVPAICPNCGATVDQSTAELTEHPTCVYCHKPLPCDPVS